MQGIMKRIYFLVLLGFYCNVYAQVSGCTDPLSDNYNPQATVNDGSCSYMFTLLSPSSSAPVPAVLKETSGLVSYNGLLYTHNDSDDANIYEIDSATGQILKTIQLPGIINKDWEEIAQDENYFYVGDFGNNSNGNRTDLKIIRISKQTAITGNPVPEIISFTYSNQSDFTASGGNNTDMDCEAMIVTDSGIYLFTKQWVSNGTMVYFLPKVPGSYAATPVTGYNVQGLITGATYVKDKNIIVLCGYSSLLQPFVYLLYDFTGNDFFSGTKRKIVLDIPFHQVEGIATANGLDYYITNERFSQLNINAKLHTINLESYLQAYFNSITLTDKKKENSKTIIYPNPAEDVVYINTENTVGLKLYVITDNTGRVVQQGNLNTGTSAINIEALPAGIYYIKTDNSTMACRLVKK